MRLLAIFVSLFLLFALQHQNKKSTTPQQAPQQEQRGTQDSPLMVKVIPSPKTAEETQQEAEDRKEKATNDTNLVNAQWVLAGIGVLQLIVFGAQALMLKKTVDASADQSTAMSRHIDEAARSATAMEAIANKIEDGNQMIMRAYVTVTIGNVVFQERNRVGQADLKFEGTVQVLNTGNTPARKVRIRKAAAIVPVPIPADFTFPIAQESEAVAYAALERTNPMLSAPSFLILSQMGT
jgi:hypothetical protein